MKYVKTFLLSIIIFYCISCTTFTTGLDTGKELDFNKDKIGEACGHYLLGSIDASWIGVIGIRFKGEESATIAAENGGITKPFAVEYENKNYILYTRKCVIVRGE